MNNKILSIKKTSAIFLAIVLVAGVITIASPFSASAQEYHGYENEYNSYDQYKPEMRYDGSTFTQEHDGYEKEYNSYDQYKPEMRYGKSEPIPGYNDYYEPMKQQQSSYDNNNDGYDNNQKIPYNNSYEGMNKYSTYPTKDKKYVCQTGQFEGFFVESVEFCKLKIPAGPQGPEGPAGQINFTNTYQVVGNGTNTGETPSRAFSVAFCDPGDIVLEGGGGVASFFDEGLGNVFLLIQEPVNEGNGYRVGGVAANTGFDSNAICIDNPPLR